MNDPIVVGLAERVRTLEITQDVNLRAIEQRLAALERALSEQSASLGVAWDAGAALAGGPSQRTAQDLRELAARRAVDGRRGGASEAEA